MSYFYIFIFIIFNSTNRKKYDVLCIVLKIILYEFRICTCAYTLLSYFLRNLSIYLEKSKSVNVRQIN